MTRSPHDGLRIHIAHAINTVRLHLQDILLSLGHVVTLSTADGHELLAINRQTPADLLLIDQHLCNLAGDSLLQQLAIQQSTCTMLIIPATSGLAAAGQEMKWELESSDQIFGIIFETTTADQLRPSIYVAVRRFDQMNRVRSEIVALRNQVFGSDTAIPGSEN